MKNPIARASERCFAKLAEARDTRADKRQLAAEERVRRDEGIARIKIIDNGLRAPDNLYAAINLLRKYVVADEAAHPHDRDSDDRAAGLSGTGEARKALEALEDEVRETCGSFSWHEAGICE